MTSPLERSDEIAVAVRDLRARLDSLGGDRVRILAVAKGFPWVDVRAAMAAGIECVGENYAQEVASKYACVAVSDRPEIHFIGRIQTNKISQLASYVSIWQTVDRPRIIDTISRRAPGSRIMIQVNATGEEDKGGCAPAEVHRLVDGARSSGLDVLGLMVVGPTSGDLDSTRAAFSLVSRLREDLGLAELSMGMSGDLELAVEWGTTMVRVGSALFGGRPPKN